MSASRDCLAPKAIARFAMSLTIPWATPRSRRLAAPDERCATNWSAGAVRAGRVLLCEGAVSVDVPLRTGAPVLSEARGRGVSFGLVGSWGVASFENDAAGEWFLLVEEALDPGAVMASAIDEVLSAAKFLEVGLCCEALAARGVLRVLRRSAAGSAAGQCLWLGLGESSRAARRSDRAGGSGRQSRARGERAARPPGGRGRQFSVAG